MLRMINKAMKGISSDKKGVTAVEYALMGALIAAALVTATTALQGKISTAFTTIGTSI